MKVSSPCRAWLPAIVIVLASVAGCGGGSGTTSTTTTTTIGAGSGAGSGSGSPSTGSERLPGHPKIAAEPDRHRLEGESESRGDGSLTRAGVAAAERKAQRRRRAGRRKLSRKAGSAAPFLVSEGDNSIPTYGAEASASVQGEAERVLSAYLQAREAENWSVACAAMSAQVTKQLVLLSGQSGTGCAAAYAALSAHGSAAERADPMVGGIVSLRVESPHAFALFLGSGKQQYMMPLEEEGRAWKVTQIAPVPWPIGSSGEG